MRWIYTKTEDENNCFAANNFFLILCWHFFRDQELTTKSHPCTRKSWALQNASPCEFSTSQKAASKLFPLRDKFSISSHVQPLNIHPEQQPKMNLLTCLRTGVELIGVTLLRLRWILWGRVLLITLWPVGKHRSRTFPCREGPLVSSLYLGDWNGAKAFWESERCLLLFPSLIKENEIKQWLVISKIRCCSGTLNLHHQALDPRFLSAQNKAGCGCQFSVWCSGSE